MYNRNQTNGEWPSAKPDATALLLALKARHAAAEVARAEQALDSTPEASRRLESALAASYEWSRKADLSRKDQVDQEDQPFSSLEGLIDQPFPHGENHEVCDLASPNHAMGGASLPPMTDHQEITPSAVLPEPNRDQERITASPSPPLPMTDQEKISPPLKPANPTEGCWVYDARTFQPATPSPAPNPAIDDFIRELCVQVIHNPPDRQGVRQRRWRLKVEVNQDPKDHKKWRHGLSATLAPKEAFKDFLFEVLGELEEAELTDEEVGQINLAIARMKATLKLGEWDAYGLLQPITGGRPRNPRQVWGFCGVRFHGNTRMDQPDLKHTGEVFVYLHDQYWRLGFQKGQPITVTFNWRTHWMDGSKKTSSHNGKAVDDDVWAEDAKRRNR